MLLEAIVLALEEAVSLRERYGLYGYLIVGSRPLLGPDVAGSADSDVVLLAREGTPKTLRHLCPTLKPSAERRVWVVSTAIVNILCVEEGPESLDLLWLGGCTFSEPMDPNLFVAFEVDDDRYTLPDEDALGPEGDSILLTRLFRGALQAPNKAFSPELLQIVRQWAKARHLYGSRYG